MKCRQVLRDEWCCVVQADRFDVKIDFAIEDSLPRLLRDGLVEPGADASDPRIKAVPLDVAHERLVEKWKTCAPQPRILPTLCTHVQQILHQTAHTYS
jgi:hypothetical protein